MGKDWKDLTQEERNRRREQNNKVQSKKRAAAREAARKQEEEEEEVQRLAKEQAEEEERKKEANREKERVKKQRQRANKMNNGTPVKRGRPPAGKSNGNNSVPSTPSKGPGTLGSEFPAIQNSPAFGTLLDAKEKGKVNEDEFHSLAELENQFQKTQQAQFNLLRTNSEKHVYDAQLPVLEAHGKNIDKLKAAGFSEKELDSLQPRRLGDGEEGNDDGVHDDRKLPAVNPRKPVPDATTSAGPALPDLSDFQQKMPAVPALTKSASKKQKAPAMEEGGADVHANSSKTAVAAGADTAGKGPETAQSSSSKSPSTAKSWSLSGLLGFGSKGVDDKMDSTSSGSKKKAPPTLQIVIGPSVIQIDCPESIVWNPTSEKGQPMLVKDDLNGNMVLVLTQLRCSKKDCMLRDDSSECCCLSKRKSLQYVGVDGRPFDADAIVCQTPWHYNFKAGQSVLCHEDPFPNGDGIYPIAGITAGVKKEGGKTIGVPMYTLRSEIGATFSVNEHEIELWTSKGTDDDDNKGFIKGRANLYAFGDDDDNDDDDDDDDEAAGMMPESNRKPTPSTSKISSSASKKTPCRVDTIERDSESSPDDEKYSPKAEDGEQDFIVPSPTSQAFFASKSKSPSKKNSSSSSSSSLKGAAASDEDIIKNIVDFLQSECLKLRGLEEEEDEASILVLKQSTRQSLIEKFDGKRIEIHRRVAEEFGISDVRVKGFYPDKPSIIEEILKKASFDFDPVVSTTTVPANARRTLGHDPPKTPAKNSGSGRPPLGRSTVKKPAKKQPPHGQPPAEDETGSQVGRTTTKASSTKKSTAKKRDKDPKGDVMSPPARRTRSSRKAAETSNAAAAAATPSASSKTKNKRATPSSKQGTPSKRTKTSNAASPAAAAATSSNDGTAGKTKKISQYTPEELAEMRRRAAKNAKGGKRQR